MAAYKGIQGYSVQKLSSDPGTLGNVKGQLWYNSASGKFKIGTIGAGAWASGGDLNTQKTGCRGSGTVTAGLVTMDSTPISGPTELYDGTSWTEVTDLTTGRYAGSVFGTQTATVCATGGTPNGVANVEIWNGTGWTETTDVTTPRRFDFGVGTTTAGMIYGGQNGGYLGNCEQWNGVGWTEVADLNYPRASMGGAGTTTAAIAFGGYPPASGSPNLAMEDWDGTSWTQGVDLNGFNYNPGAAGNATAAIKIGGGGGTTTQVETYNGSSWTEVAALTNGIDDGAGLGNDGSTTALIAGGNAPHPGVLVEEWNSAPATAKVVTVS